MKHSVARSGMNLLLCAVAVPAIAAQSEQTPAEATHAPLTIIQHGSSNWVPSVSPTGEPASEGQGADGQNSLMFAIGDQANEFSQRMKARLADPEQRAVLRAEQRAAVLAQNAGVGRLVGLEPALEQKLIELLTDQQMERLEQIYVQPPPTLTDLQKYADETTQRMNALRDLLGEEKLARYQDFEMNQSGRHWVGQFSARLAPPDRLQPDQEDQLTALKQEQFEKASVVRGWRVFRIGESTSMQDLQRNAQRQTRIENENCWRRQQVENRTLEQKAAAFLTSTQLAELVRYQAQEQDNLKRFVESARAEAGLDRQIPEVPEVMEQPSKLIEGELQVELRLTVNRQLTTVTRTVRNGESFTFETAQGLIVEATPKMYEDDWLDVHLSYYEDRVTGRRRLSGGSISTLQQREADGSLSGGGGSVITGRRGYAVETNIDARML